MSETLKVADSNTEKKRLQFMPGWFEPGQKSFLYETRRHVDAPAAVKEQDRSELVVGQIQS